MGARLRADAEAEATEEKREAPRRDTRMKQ
jgi:hypothetical protein